jgi:predicted ATPase
MCFLSQIDIQAIGPLRDCTITLSSQERQHLILTGRNGSGKTTVLQAVRAALAGAAASASDAAPPLTLTFSGTEDWSTLRRRNACTTAYYPASFSLTLPMSISDAPPAQGFWRSVAHLHIEQIRAQASGQPETAQRREAWLVRLNQALQVIFDDPTLTLQYQPQPPQFTLHSRRYAPIDCARLSDGQQRILSILADLLMRSEHAATTAAGSDLPGMVLIDGLEIALHPETQRQILPLFVNLFPTWQFLVSTHSPFVMNSLESAVVFDLDRHARINAVLTYPYETILERDDLRQYSDQIRQLLGEYEDLLNTKQKTEREEFRLLELGNYLAWVLSKFRKERQCP